MSEKKQQPLQIVAEQGRSLIASSMCSWLGTSGSSIEAYNRLTDNK